MRHNIFSPKPRGRLIQYSRRRHDYETAWFSCAKRSRGGSATAGASASATWTTATEYRFVIYLLCWVWLWYITALHTSSSRTHIHRRYKRTTIKPSTPSFRYDFNWPYYSQSSNHHKSSSYPSRHHVIITIIIITVTDWWQR